MANPTVADVIKRARSFVKDEDGTKWGDDVMLAFLNTAIHKLYELHPSAFYVTTIVTSEPSSVTLDGDIAVAPVYGEAFAHYIASQCLLDGADDEFNARLSKNHLDLFNEA